MTRNEVLAEIKELIEEYEMEEDAVEPDVNDWDSIAFISILRMAEDRFHIRFTVEDFQSISSMNDLANVICQRMD